MMRHDPATRREGGLTSHGPAAQPGGGLRQNPIDRRGGQSSLQRSNASGRGQPGDFEVIPIPDTLRRKALVFDCTVEEGIQRAVRRAESSVEQMGEHFEAWMGEEVERLCQAHRDFRAAPGNADRRTAFFRVAHDLRGHAALLNYPLAGRICQSLARLLSLSPSLPLALVDRHVDALRAVVREKATGVNDPIGSALADHLELLAEDNLKS